jgi:hypothetical protein
VAQVHGGLTASPAGHLAIVPPGGIKWLKENIASLHVTLTPDELARLDPLGGQVTGARY